MMGWQWHKLNHIEGSMHKGSISKKILIFQETTFCVLQVLVLDFTNTIWQLYIDFHSIRIIFESSFQLCILKLLI